MDRDIRWILERRHQDGRWEAVQSDHRYLAEAEAADPGPFAKTLLLLRDPSSPRRVLGRRAPEAFARLSGIDASPQDIAPLARRGLPRDLSPWSSDALALGLWHACGRPGHLGPESLPALDHPDTAAFRGALLDLLASPLSAIPLAAPSLEGREIVYADLHQAENAHARLAREARGADLLSPDAPDSWRLLLAYRP